MDELKRQIKQLIIDSLDLEDMSVSDIDDDMLLFSTDGLGLDSVDALELGLALQKQFGFSLENDSSKVREHFLSVNTLANFIKSHQ